MADVGADGASRHSFPPTRSDDYASGNDEGSRRDVVFDMSDASPHEDDAGPSQYRGVASVVDRSRHALARFGRLTGMHLPGISYTSLRNEGEGSTSRRPMGGGIIQDGVFSNMNAKPEGRRSRRTDDPNDRGDDDDLADDTLPPTYEAAAADIAPTYWESTVFGGNALAESEGGWTPDGANIGEVPDMIVDGMLLGTLFGFFWNFFISASFQFVGFVITFLLHSTNAAKYGGRAGLGVTLLQFAASLLWRIADAEKELAHNKPDAQKDEHKGRKHLPTREEIEHSRLTCRLLLIFGIALTVFSVGRFIQLYRRSSKIVAEARRNNPARAAEAENADADAAQEQPVGFFQAFAGPDPVTSMNQAFGRWRDSFLVDIGLMHPVGMHSAEDYIIRPGRGVEPDVLFAADASMTSHAAQLAPAALPRTSNALDPFSAYMFPTTVDDLESGRRP